MFFYLLIILLASALGFVYQRTLKGFDSELVGRLQRPFKLTAGFALYVLSFLVLFIPAALRHDVGTDYQSYYRWFQDIATGKDTYFEPGFVVIVNSVVGLGMDPQWIFALASLLTLMLVYIAIYRGSTNLAFSIFLFTTLAFYFVSFNIVRQFIAVAIILFGFRYIINANFLKYVLTIAIAYMFHATALIMLPAYFLFRFNYRRFGYAALLLAMSVATIHKDSLIDIFVRFYPIYQDREDILSRMIFSELFIGIGVLTLILMMYLKSRKKFSILKSKLDLIVFNTIFLSLAAHVLLAWIPAINRLLYYIDILYILLLPILVSRISDKGMRRVIIACFAIMLVVYLYISLQMNGSYDVLPYKTILSR